MFNISIIMDRRENAEILAEYIKRDGFEVETFTNTSTLILDIKDQDYHPSIVFIETIIDKCNGIGIAAKIKRLLPHTQIVFVALKNCSSLDVYDVEHVYTIYSELTEAKIDKALRLAEKKLSIKENLPFWYMKNGRKIWVAQSEIAYFEKDKRLVRIHLANGSIDEFYETMEELISSLSSNFIRCHNSYVVNADYVEAYGKATLSLKGDMTVPVSRAYLKSIKEQLNNAKA